MAIVSHTAWVIIPAAGSGARFGSDLPKQYHDLRGRRVLEHTIDRLRRGLNPRLVVVAIAPGDTVWPTLSVAGEPGVESVEGGADRAASVANALAALDGRADERDWVVVHDAARPCVAMDDLRNLVDRLPEDCCGGLLATPVADTLKRVDDTMRVETTVDRSHLWQAQTPQVFQYGILSGALAQARAAGQPVTDEASAVEFAGYRPRIVPGSPLNIKITNPEDLHMAASILDLQAGRRSPVS